MTIPPLNQSILYSGKDGVTVHHTIGKLEAVDHVENRNGYPGPDIEPDGYIKVLFTALENGHEHIQAEYDPDQGNGYIYGPFQFGIFFTRGESHRQGDQS